jgi:Transposase
MVANFDEPTTNGYAEGVINEVKVIKRRAYGLPSFGAFRERAPTCPWTGALSPPRSIEENQILNPRKGAVFDQARHSGYAYSSH